MKIKNFVDMKITIKYTLIYTLILCASLFYSCEDFLEKEPPGSAAGSVMQSPEGVESLLIGAYSTLQGAGRFGGAMATDWTYGSGASDDCYKGTSSGDQNNFNDVEKYAVLPTNEYMGERWRDCYNGVSRTNQTLSFLWATQAGTNPLPEARAKEIEGEAKFLRAWFHFKATIIFKNIPYILTQEELGEGMLPEQIPNSSEGWDEIETDLKYAIDNLPEESPQGDPGRANKFSATAMLAKVHMYQNELSQAKPLLDNIISSSKFRLVDNYNDNYDMATENNEESIFEIQAGTSGANHSSMLLAGPTMHQAGPAGIGWGFYQPSQNLFEAYQVTEEGLPVLDDEARKALVNDMGIASTAEFHPTDELLDPRVDWTISRRGIDYLGWGICEGRSWIREQPNGGPYMSKKFMHKASNQSLNTNGSGFDNGKNFRAIRFSHILLWRAEIAVEDGELEAARQLVNQIRERAQKSEPVMGRVSTYVFDGRPLEVDWEQPAANYKVEVYPEGADAFSSQDKARKAVRLEQRLEFATEGMRFFDLRRWGIDDEVLNNYIKQDSEFRTFLKGVVYNPNRASYWPLPQSQLDIQQGILSQDPNYK